MQFFTDALTFFKEGAQGCFGTEKTAKTVLLVLAVFSLLHILTVLLPNFLGRITAYLNILVHVLAILLFMKLQLTIYQAVLVFMASIFVYSLLNFIPYVFYRASLKREEREENK